MTTQEIIFQQIQNHTSQMIESGQIDGLGLTTSELAKKLILERSSVSRYLNTLFSQGKLIKTTKRPVRYMDKEILHEFTKNDYIPSILPIDKEVIDYIEFKETSLSDAQNEVDAFRQYLQHPKAKMAEPIQIAKSAINYPTPLNILIRGDIGSGRLDFARNIALYAKQTNLIPKQLHPIEIDCQSYQTLTDEKCMKFFFGEYDRENDHLQKGALFTQKHNIIILNHFDALPFKSREAILNAIVEKRFQVMI